MLHLTNITFKNYKPFKNYTVSLNEFNILVGPNNAGKSTILGALKILGEGLKKARSIKPKYTTDITGKSIFAYYLNLDDIPVATENVFYNYEDENPAIIKFKFSNKSTIELVFPEKGECYMACDSPVKVIKSPKDFKECFNLEIGFVPILGPVDHKENLFQKEAARQALLTYKASRNFRNIWHHFNEDFEEFRELIKSTWPGMDINPPEIDYSGDRPTINIFCPEERMPREIFWAGFGFQVWCQMLTFIIKNKNATLFIIDEPDIYLHSDLQRQLLGILKNLGPDIIIATHSTELISEAEINDILLINKLNPSAKRIKNPLELQKIFNVLGSNLNPVLTQIAKTRRVLFVEGKDFLLFSRLARKIKLEQVANRSDFAVIPVEGFNPQRLKVFKEGIERTIGTSILSSVIFDRDYRSDAEITEEEADLKKDNYFVHIHSNKELENFLIIPNAINQAIVKKIKDQNQRTGKEITFTEDINSILEILTDDFKIKLQSQLQAKRMPYEKILHKGLDESTLIEKFIKEFELTWKDVNERFKLIPGKDFLSCLNEYLQNKYSITITQTNIIDSISTSDFPTELRNLLNKIDQFRKEQVE